MADEVAKVCDFLKRRGLKRETVDKFKEEKMDYEAIEYASDDILVSLGLVAKGDILALRRFADVQLNPSNKKGKEMEKGKDERDERKRQLYDLIMSKANKRKKADSSNSRPPVTTRSRHVSLGWLHYDEKKNKYVSVRCKRGGGSREVSLNSTSTKDEIMECAKKLFFPDGKKSVFGSESEMTFDLGNFKEETITDIIRDDSNDTSTPFTLEAYFKAYKLSRVRLYLMTKKINDIKSTWSDNNYNDEQSEDEEELPAFMLHSDDDKELSTARSSYKELSEDEEDLPAFIVPSGEDKELPTARSSNKELSTASSSKLLGNSSERSALKALQDIQFFDSLRADQMKEQKKALETGKEKSREETEKRLEILRLVRQNRVSKEPALNENHVLVQVRHHERGIIRRRFQPSNSMLQVYDWVGSLGMLPEHFELSIQPGCTIAPDEAVAVVEGKMVYMTKVDNPIHLSKEEQDVTFIGYGPDLGEELLDSTLLDQETHQSEELPDNRVLDTGPDFDVDKVSANVPSKLLSDDESSIDIDTKEQDSTVPSQPVPQDQQGRAFRRMLNEMYNTDLDYDDLLTGIKRIVVPRDDILSFMLNLYEDEDICQSSLVVAFENELGSDLGGVSRDLFSCFWDKAYETYFDGDTVKIPFVPPQKMSEAQAIFKKLGRIFSHGFLVTKTIPVRFCEVSVVAVLFGEEKVSDEQLISSFLNFITSWEKELFLRGLKGALKPQDDNDVFSAFSRFGMRCSPSKKAGHFKSQVISMAKSELLYKPSTLLNWMRQGIPSDHYDMVWSKFSREEFAEFYEALVPTTENVAGAITCDGTDLTAEQDRVIHFLRCFVLSLDQVTLEKFLHFVTGTSVSPRHPIKVAFNSSFGLVRAPSASTCGSVVCLSTNYESFHEFKCEFLNVLQSGEAFMLSNV